MTRVHGDGKTDIGLTGMSGWGSLPVAKQVEEGRVVAQNHLVFRLWR
jgi:hypothetical protein